MHRQDLVLICLLRRSAAITVTPPIMCSSMCWSIFHCCSHACVKLHPIHIPISQRRLGAACRAACEPAATVALVRYVDTVTAHPAFVNDGAASSGTTTTLAPFLRAACAEAAATGVGGDHASDTLGVGGNWLDNLVGVAVAASTPNGSERCDATLCLSCFISMHIYFAQCGSRSVLVHFKALP